MTNMNKLSVVLAQFALLLSMVFAPLFVPAAQASSEPAAADDNNEVIVIVNDQLTMNFSGAARLDTVLNTALQQWQANRANGLPALDVYWPNARLAMVSGPYSEQAELEARREQLIEDLQSLSEYWLAKGEREKAAQAIDLVRQLAGMLVAWQPFGQPELAGSRLFLQDNPLLQPGVYHLTLPNREAHFYVYGLTKSAGKQPVLSQQTVRGYLHAHLANELFWPSADRNHALRFDNATAAEELPWAYYNARAEHLMPGQILYIPFKRSELPRPYRHVNDEAAYVLQHWFEDPAAQWMDNSVSTAAEQRIPDIFHWERLDLSPSSSNYGGVGLLQTPTARMAPEGEFTFNYTDMKEYRRYNINLQVLPWLEAGGFYARLPNRLFSSSPGFSGDNMYADKGFDLKIRLWQESYYIPEISVALRDFAGTGLFSDESIIASKRFGPLDVSLGIGFGRLGTRGNISNPFCEVADGFCDRPGGFSGRGGVPEIGQWFRGDASLFGGIEYQTPIPGLRFKAEYEGNDYSRDRSGVDMTPSSPWNFGMMYRPVPNLDIQFGVERGDIFTLGFTLRTNFNTMNQIKVQPAKIEPQAPRADSLDDVHWNAMNRRIRRQYAYDSTRFHMTEDEEGYTVTAFVNPRRFRDPDEQVERAARVLAAELPESVHTYEFVEQAAFMPILTTRVPAAEFRAQISNEIPGEPVENVARLFERADTEERPEWDDEGWVLGGAYRFAPSWGMRPFFQQDFGAPETFHFYQLGVYGFGHHWFNDKTWLFGEVGLNISNNYDRFNFTVDAFDDLPLERVRTFSREYMLNDVWLDNLIVTRFERLSKSVYAMGYAGILERMYGGAGAEVLWRPLDSSFALGVDINRVRQRDFSGGLGFRDYEVTTGFVTAYYQMPWLKDSLLQVGFGQFLAGDRGARIQFQRRFDSGIVVGAYAHLTNVSSEDYGEGSFTKGLFVNIPFDLLSVLPSRQRIGFGWVPLSRDGGQPLHRRVELYGVTDPRSPFYMR